MAASLLAFGCGEPVDLSPGTVEGAPRSRQAAWEAQQEARAELAAPAQGEPSRILFGDLHVHTSYSWDGLLATLPLVGGEGTHPPADACDFARYCSDLDFFALTDHAESLTPAQWALSKESIRACNAVAGSASDPDLVAFMGFEWSQAGLTPETHWGHRCVIFPETGEGDLPPRPIGSADTRERFRNFEGMMRNVRWLQPWDWRTYASYAEYFADLVSVPSCEPGVDTTALPDDCREVATTPAELHARLDRWGLESLEIPHGSTWGVYTPATTSIDKHLDPAQYDPERQQLIEIMSGHGNSEEYRSFAAFDFDDEGERVCPEPSQEYLPCCWQAGEIMRSRCGDLPEEECERRVEEARGLAVQAWTRPQQVFSDAAPEDWLDCGQCRDCFKPSYGYRPRESVQYAMALSKGSDAEPLRFRYGFVASSDNHTARPGTGYKQLDRGMMTDVVGTPGLLVRGIGKLASRMDDPRRPQRPEAEQAGILNTDMRVQSFLYPGGLAAVHARGSGRRAIWEAMRRREVYGTSGPHMLLWFDALNGERRRPMGSELRLDEAPRFEVRAVGDFVQQPGCPEQAVQGLREERIRKLCHDECYHAGAERHPIVAIEVVRIRPQVAPEEPVEALVEDPWQRFECEPDPAGCVVRFEDEEFVRSGRDALYYVRALQEPTPALNGAPLGTSFDAYGDALATHPCLGPGSEDGCPAPVQERAWSSPIFVDQR